MKLKILIEESCKHPAGRYTTIALSSIDYNENVTFPFEEVVSTFKTLYPDKNLIFTFKIL